MDSQQDDRQLIIEQYRIYSDAKERFIDRQFTTNKFYLVLKVRLPYPITVVHNPLPKYILDHC